LIVDWKTAGALFLALLARGRSEKSYNAEVSEKRREARGTRCRFAILPVRMSAALLQWFEDHERFAAAGVLLAALLVRLWAAHGTFLNPDEALHFQVANHASWEASYQASLTTAHPPLLIFVLHFWRALGTSEWMLRLPSVIAGTAFCWFLFRWMSPIFGRTPAWSALIFFSFLPPLIALSSEVRQYGLLLCFLGASLYLVERALDEKSAIAMVLAYVCVCLAVLTHYSGLLFAAALAAYLFFRLMEQGFPARVKIAWGASQIVLLVLFDFLYRTHLERLNAGEAITSQPWLANSIFHRERQDLFVFVLGRSFGVFQFVFGQLAVGDVAGLLFLAGVVLLIGGPQRPKPVEGKGVRSEAVLSREDSKLPGIRARWIALLLLLPFVLNCGAAVVGAYPYGGTRHSAFLIPFALAGVAIGLAWLVKQDFARGMALAVAIVVVSAAFGSPHRPFMTRADQNLDNMSRAMTFLQQRVPPEGVIVIDYQTSLLFARYLCGPEAVAYDRSIAGFLIFRCGRFRVLSSGPQTPSFTAPSFLADTVWKVMGEKLGMHAGERFWAVQAGWDIGLGRELRAEPQFRNLKVQSFGKNIEMFEMGFGSAGPVVAVDSPTSETSATRR
jgi:hypothetical protein